jgi:hypothetical protein
MNAAAPITNRQSPIAKKKWRLGLCAAVILGLSPFLVAADDPALTKTQEFKGKVVPLAAVLEKQGVKLDSDAASTSLALVGDEGKVYPLIKDDGSRMFYLDKSLLNRPMRLTGRLLPDSQLLQVLVVHSYVKGELCEVYYWCDVCTIRRNEKRICECCGGPMELREVPVKK